MLKLKTHTRAITLVLVLLLAVVPAGYVKAGSSFAYPVMRLSAEQRALQNQQALAAPAADIDANIRQELASRLQGSSLSLLSRISYVPQERDQGANGSCWVWTGTGIMEIALNVQQNITARLSIQYLMSNYNGGSGPNWAGNGGDAALFASFYNTQKKIIPWSNLNAGYQDTFSTTGTIVPASSIVTTPNYGIASVTAAIIPTWGNGKDAAILNIKSILNQNRAVFFGFYLANASDWNQFFSFWDNQSESALWEYGFSDGKPYDPVTGGGHGLLCVGYDDSDPDPSQHYWLMVNSWGTAAGRPNDLLRIPMEYTYDAADSSGAYNTEWWTITPTYLNAVDKAADTPAVPSSVINPKSSTPGNW